MSATAVEVLAEGLTISATNGNVTAYSPGTLIYAATGSDNNIHVYGLQLSDTTSTPTPQQVSTLSLALPSGGAISSVICADSSTLSASNNIANPATLFVVLHIADPSLGCNHAGDTWEVVHYQDSATTAPTPVSGVTASPTYFQALYNSSGALAGLAWLNPTSSSLNLYANDSFTNPTALISSVNSVSTLYSSNNNLTSGSVTGTTLFLDVTNTSSKQFVYQLTNSGTLTKEYSAAGTLSATGVADDNNVYFTDTGSIPSGGSYASVVVNGIITGNLPPTFGSLPVSGTLTPGSPTGTAVLVSGGTLTVTSTEVATTKVGAGAATSTTAGNTSTFTGTYSGGVFTGQAGTSVTTSCLPAGQACAVILGTATGTYNTVTGTVAASSAGGTLTTTFPEEGGSVIASETWTFSNFTPSGPVTSTEVLWKLPLAGGSATQLYSSTGSSYQLLGANDAEVVFYINGTGTSSLYTVPVNTLSSSATTLVGSPYTGTISAGSSFLLPTTPGSAASSDLFLNVIATTPISEVLSLTSASGTVLQQPLAGSTFLYFGASPLSGSVLQIQGITAGGEGGGQFYSLSLANLTAPATVLNTYTISAGSVAALVGLSNTIGAGASGASGVSTGLAYDLSKNLIVPITLSNTNVTLGL